MDTPSSIPVNDMALFPSDTSCMNMFGDEEICKALLSLQVTANGLKQSINEIILEKDEDIDRLNNILQDRPMTTQEQNEIFLQIQGLEAEVERLQKIERGMRNIPPVIREVNKYFSNVNNELSKKRKLGGEQRVPFGAIPIGDAEETDDEADEDFNPDMEEE
jgi:hypothetical protein